MQEETLLGREIATWIVYIHLCLSPLKWRGCISRCNLKEKNTLSRHICKRTSGSHPCLCLGKIRGGSFSDQNAMFAQTGTNPGSNCRKAELSKPPKRGGMAGKIAEMKRGSVTRLPGPRPSHCPYRRAPGGAVHETTLPNIAPNSHRKLRRLRSHAHARGGDADAPNSVRVSSHSVFHVNEFSLFLWYAVGLSTVEAVVNV